MFDFSKALKIMKKGKYVSRYSYKNAYIGVPEDVGGEDTYFHIVNKNMEEICDVWTPHQRDIFAEDWYEKGVGELENFYFSTCGQCLSIHKIRKEEATPERCTRCGSYKSLRKT